MVQEPTRHQGGGGFKPFVAGLQRGQDIENEVVLRRGFPVNRVWGYVCVPVGASLGKRLGRPYPCAGPGCAYDFSQFKPRGHYTETPELEQYFRAMIWLGRTDIMLTRFLRELVVTAELNRHLAAESTFANWQAVEQVIAVLWESATT